MMISLSIYFFQLNLGTAEESRPRRHLSTRLSSITSSSSLPEAIEDKAPFGVQQKETYNAENEEFYFKHMPKLTYFYTYLKEHANIAF